MDHNSSRNSNVTDEERSIQIDPLNSSRSIPRQRAQDRMIWLPAGRFANS